MRRYEAALGPFTVGKGLDWEVSSAFLLSDVELMVRAIQVNLDEADQVTWHENGMSPPAPDSEGEALWKKLNKPVPFEGPAFSNL